MRVFISNSPPALPSTDSSAEMRQRRNGRTFTSIVIWKLLESQAKTLPKYFPLLLAVLTLNSPISIFLSQSVSGK